MVRKVVQPEVRIVFLHGPKHAGVSNFIKCAERPKLKHALIRHWSLYGISFSCLRTAVNNYFGSSKGSKTMIKNCEQFDYIIYIRQQTQGICREELQDRANLTTKMKFQYLLSLISRLQRYFIWPNYLKSKIEKYFTLF